jgi:hypothetical protein
MYITKLSNTHTHTRHTVTQADVALVSQALDRLEALYESHANDVIVVQTDAERDIEVPVTLQFKMPRVVSVRISLSMCVHVCMCACMLIPVYPVFCVFLYLTYTYAHTHTRHRTLLGSISVP